MKILIIEDEIRAAIQLQKMLIENFEELHVLGNLESVEDSVEWLNNNIHPDLIFMDIQLADGLSFEIFQQVELEVPVIFTTAYNEYSIKAFKVNSIDYLLKPIQEKDLFVAVEKYKKLYQNSDNSGIDISSLEKLLGNVTTDNSRKRFVVKEGSSSTFIQIEDVLYFYSEDGISFLWTKNNKRYIVEMTLDAIEKEISSKKFFRINRGQIVGIAAIQTIHSYFNHRLKLEVLGNSKFEFIVSRNRTSDFNKWIDQ